MINKRGKRSQGTRRESPPRYLPPPLLAGEQIGSSSSPGPVRRHADGLAGSKRSVSEGHPDQPSQKRHKGETKTGKKVSTAETDTTACPIANLWEKQQEELDRRAWWDQCIEPMLNLRRDNDDVSELRSQLEVSKWCRTALAQHVSKLCRDKASQEQKNRDLARENAEQVSTLCRDKASLQENNRDLAKDNAKLRRMVREKDRNLEAEDVDWEIRAKIRELKAKDDELRAKDEEIRQLKLKMR